MDLIPVTWLWWCVVKDKNTVNTTKFAPWMTSSPELHPALTSFFNLFFKSSTQVKSVVWASDNTFSSCYRHTIDILQQDIPIVVFYSVWLWSRSLCPPRSPPNGCLCVVLVAVLHVGGAYGGDLQPAVPLTGRLLAVCSRWSCSLAASPASCRNCVSCPSSTSATRASSECCFPAWSRPATTTLRTRSSCSRRWAVCCSPPSFR